MDTVVKLTLFSVDDIKKFVNIANSFPNEVYVISGEYKVSGKSLMGVLSLDLSKPIIADFVDEVPQETAEALKQLGTRRAYDG